jgi:hypothetical protein
MRRVLFVGGGASKPFKIPLTGEILPSVVRRLRNNAENRLFCKASNKERAEGDAGFLAEGLRVLYPGIRLDGSANELKALPYVTEVLSFIDFLIANGQPPKPRWDLDKLIRLRTLFDRAICEVLWSPFELDRPDPGVWTTPSDPKEGPTHSGRGPADSESQDELCWQNFKRFIESKVADASDHLTVITTNYDLLLDTILGEVAKESESGVSTQIDRGFVYRMVDDEGGLAARPAGRGNRRGILPKCTSIAARLALYKLHGSLNYLQCQVCDQVYFNPNGRIVDLAFEYDVMGHDLSPLHSHELFRRVRHIPL